MQERAHACPDHDVRRRAGGHCDWIDVGREHAIEGCGHREDEVLGGQEDAVYRWSRGVWLES